uniref:Uncharacterized protein n=1 Tax=Steinernema glaseri TaxID=37863 RepID=A0A1I7ZAR7_9BILA
MSRAFGLSQCAKTSISHSPQRGSSEGLSRTRIASRPAIHGPTSLSARATSISRQDDGVYLHSRREGRSRGCRRRL